MMGFLAVEKARRTKLTTFMARISQSLRDQESLSLYFFSLTFSLLSTAHIISVHDCSVAVKWHIRIKASYFYHSRHCAANWVSLHIWF